MNKLIELSVRGSLYFYLGSLSENQLKHLRQFAKQFYMSNPVCEYASDDEVMKCFTLAVKQTFGIELTNIPVTAVLVIK